MSSWTRFFHVFFIFLASSFNSYECDFHHHVCSYSFTLFENIFSFISSQDVKRCLLLCWTLMWWMYSENSRVINYTPNDGKYLFFRNQTCAVQETDFPAELAIFNDEAFWLLIFRVWCRALCGIASFFSISLLARTLMALFLLNILMIKSLFASPQICDNRTAPIGPSQNHRFAPALICRSHQSVSLSDPARS